MAYIIFATRARHSGTAAFLTKLRGMGIDYDVAYGIRSHGPGHCVIRAEMADEEYDAVELMPEVLLVIEVDPLEADDPLSGCDGEYHDPCGPLEGCDEPGDPDD